MASQGPANLRGTLTPPRGRYTVDDPMDWGAKASSRVQVVSAPPSSREPSGRSSVSGNTLHFDFGPGGLPDGYFVLEADLDGDGVFEASWRFYRMYGDMT